MSQIFDGDNVVPITTIEAGPCFVLQIKNKGKDGYEAVQTGFEKRKDKRVKKSQKKSPFRYIRELRITTTGAQNPATSESLNSAGSETQKSSELQRLQEYKIGDKIDVSVFKPGDKVSISGLTKGHGFTGVVKRHGFHGHNVTHGTKDQERMPGSIGNTAPQRVFKGKRMAGRMGHERVTIKNLEVIEVNPEKNLLVIKGAVPGTRGSLLEIKSF